jgi:hypothetical protein
MTAFSLTSGYGNPSALTDGSMKEIPISNLLGLILVELRVMNELHAEAYGSKDTVRSLREATPTEVVNTSELAPSTTISNPS